MNQKVIFILLFFLFIGTVNAGNNTTTINYPTQHLENGEMITALESGDSNISFSDNYKGYCIEWGEHSAEVGDKFYIHNDADNNIKTFFVYFYKESQRDVIATQHMIWKFTDNKQFSRFNQTLYEQIIAKSATTQVPNEGSIPYENQTMFFNFKTFISEIEEHQNYFGYKIFFKNSINQIINNTTNNLTTILPQLQNNLSQVLFNQSYTTNIINDNQISTPINEKIVISDHETGINIGWIIFIIILIIYILLFY